MSSLDHRLERGIAIGAQRWVPGAAESGSEARADAGSRRLRTVVRPRFVITQTLDHPSQKPRVDTA